MNNRCAMVSGIPINRACSRGGEFASLMNEKRFYNDRKVSLSVMIMTVEVLVR